MKDQIFGAACMISGLLICLIMVVLSTANQLNALGHFIIVVGIIVFLLGLIICLYIVFMEKD